MDKMVFIVFEDYRYNGFDEGTMVYVCETIEIAIKKVKERFEWYLKNSYLNQFVDENLNIIDEVLDEYDIWKIDNESVEIYIDSNDTALNIHIVEGNIINE